MRAICPVCTHHCRLEEGQAGLCGGRENRGGRVICTNYGKITSMALDPVEKKPLRRFYPGSRILSVGSYGCNFSCPFCQNHEISMAREGGPPVRSLPPQKLVEAALSLREQGNIGLAYTYNEPLIGYEYVRDCASLAAASGLKNAVVTNGSLSVECLEELLPFIDAFNVDLKGFTEQFYRTVNGDFEDVKTFIKTAARFSHVEVTTLVIPGENDGEEEIEALASWLASVSREIPLHLTRFFPRYHMTDRGATPIETLLKLEKTAGRHLRHVYLGNC